MLPSTDGGDGLLVFFIAGVDGLVFSIAGVDGLVVFSIAGVNDSVGVSFNGS